MNSGLYAACTALIARTQSLEVAANNLANVNTSGYRSQQGTFRSLLGQSADTSLSPLNRAINDFSVLGGSRLDLTAGNLERTGNDLDIGLEGLGFFVVQTKAGTRYTRNGRFQLSPDGLLVTATGDTVLGDQGPIRIPKGKIAFSVDGTISVDGAIAGKLRIAEFAPITALASEGGAYYSAPIGSEIKASQSRVRQGTLESSNVNSVASAVGLVLLQRHAEMLQRALTIFHSDFNRIAAEDLPRV